MKNALAQVDSLKINNTDNTSLNERGLGLFEDEVPKHLQSHLPPIKASGYSYTFLSIIMPKLRRKYYLECKRIRDRLRSYKNTTGSIINHPKSTFSSMNQQASISSISQSATTSSILDHLNTTFSKVCIPHSIPSVYSKPSKVLERFLKSQKNLLKPFRGAYQPSLYYLAEVSERFFRSKSIDKDDIVITSYNSNPGTNSNFHPAQSSCPPQVTAAMLSVINSYFGFLRYYATLHLRLKGYRFLKEFFPNLCIDEKALKVFVV